jgi:O-antigen/teichoic acid export membrane protein
MKYLKILSLYGFVVLFNALVSFVTFSLLTHYLTQADYGIINLYSSFLALLFPFIAVGVQYTLGIDFFKMTEASYRRHFTNALAVPVLSCLGFTLLFFISSGLIKELLEINDFFVYTLPLACLLTLVFDVIITLFRNKGQHLQFAGLSLSKNVVESGFTLLLVIGMGLGWEGRMGSSLLALMIVVLYIAYMVYKWRLYTGEFELGKIRRIATTGLPFVPERLAIFVLAGSDRFFIDQFSGLEQVGLYGAGAQLAIVVNLAISTLNSTFHPVLYRNLERGGSGYNNAGKATLAFIGGAALISIAVIFSSPLVFRYLIGSQFQGGQAYAVYLTIGMFFWAVYNAFIPYLLLARRNKQVMSISIIGMVISLLGNWYNVSHFGAIGAAYTSILVYFLMAAIVICFVHLQYDLRKVFAYPFLFNSTKVY